jgi:hypothetical protein
MAFLMDDGAYGGQLFVGSGQPPALGIGPKKIRGSVFVEGPAVFGTANSFPNVWATVMIGPNSNEDSPSPLIPGTLCTGVNNPYSLGVRGPSAFMDVVDMADNLNVGSDITAQGEVKSRCGTHILSAKKNFDIPHPTKPGWRLRHTCPEGPSNDVYVRGKVLNRTEIELPQYWKKLVDFTTITVSLTPIGAHQEVIVKRIDEDKVYLQSKGGVPINCFYHIFGTRMDGERLISEYEGQSPADYPGNNDEYSVSGYHYDVKE